MRFFSIKNWDDLQHYRDRTPPWIKLYNHLLDDYEFACLQDASKLHLVLIWLLASRNNNRLPFNERWIKQRIGVDSNVDLAALVDAGFIELEPSNDAVSQLAEQDASTALSLCKQSADTEERESRGEGEGEREQKHSSPSAQKSVYPDEFEWIWSNKPDREGANPKRKALHACNARIKQGATWKELAEGMKRYAQYCKAKRWLNTSSVQQMATFFGPDEHFKNSWEVNYAAQGNQSTVTGQRKLSTVDQQHAAAAEYLQRLERECGSPPDLGSVVASYE